MFSKASLVVIITALSSCCRGKLETFYPSTRGYCNLPPEPSVPDKTLTCACQQSNSGRETCVDGGDSVFMGACKTANYFCQDVAPAAPKCEKANQVLDVWLNDTDYHEPGPGKCAGCDLPPIQRFSQWRCCDCPSGWTPLWTSCNGWAFQTENSNLFPSSVCLRCSSAGETLTIDDTGTPKCTGCDGDDDDNNDGGEGEGERKREAAHQQVERAGDTKCKKPCKPKQCPVSSQPSPSASPKTCASNAEGRALTKKKEGCCLDFYTVDGRKTIGYGHDVTKNKDAGKFKPPITLEEAEQQFNEDMAKVERSIGQWNNAKGLNSNQFSALVDFAFNAGTGAPSNKKHGAWHYFHDLVQSRNYSALCNTFSHAALKANYPSILQRRMEEQALCRKPTNARSGCKG